MYTRWNWCKRAACAQPHLFLADVKGSRSAGSAGIGSKLPRIRSWPYQGGIRPSPTCLSLRCKICVQCRKFRSPD